MSVFGAYAPYYDLLYRDKDYAAETRFVRSLLAQHFPEAHDILELGCGTGMHASLLAAEGYALHGVDLSEDMLAAARARAAALPSQVAGRLRFSVGNARDCRLGRPCDAVLALFHVVSYQSTNAELLAMFETAAAHLTPGGAFVFDFWYGPAVLTERPAVRVKRMESDRIQVTRVAEPVTDTQAGCVDVNYQIFIHDKTTQAVSELRETHRMRYLFLTEIDMLARTCGFSVRSTCEWLSGRPASDATWGVCAVLTR